MKFERKTYTSSIEKLIDFFIGIVLALVMIYGPAMLFSSVPLVYSGFGLCFLALLYFALTRSWIALGIVPVFFVILFASFAGPIIFKLMLPQSPFK